MDRFIVVDNATVAIFETDEPGIVCAIFPDKTIEEVIKAVKEEYGNEVFYKTVFKSYKKGDVIERKLTECEKEMLNFRVIEQRSIQESIKLKDGSVTVND